MSSKRFFIIVIIIILFAAFFWSHLAKPTSSRSISGSPDREYARWEAVIKKYGVKEALNQALRESVNKPSLDCHVTAHTIGRIAYQLYHEQALAQCSGLCNNGCYHGAMELIVSKYGDKNLMSSLEKLCNAGTSTFKEECLHGAGHGILAYMDYDLPSALRQCQKLSLPYDREVCMTGTFMENINTAGGLSLNETVHTTRWLSNDPHFPCDAFDSKDKEVQWGCYENQTDRMLQLYQSDFTQVAKECLRAPQNAISTCFESYGRDAAGRSNLDIDQTLTLCAKIPKEKGYYEDCIRGALLQYKYFGTSDANEKTRKLCASVSSSFKQSCFKILEK